MMGDEKIVSVNNVTFAYGSDAVLRDVSVSVSPGDFMGIIGPNGGGKTTLLRLILGILKPQEGSVQLFGGLPAHTRKMAGYVSQETSLNKQFPISVMDVVLMGRARYRGPGRFYTSEDRDRAQGILAGLHLDGVYNRRIGDLSGGQRQKALLARALVGDPAVLFLDEPTSGSDPAGQTEIYDYLQSLNQRGTTVVLVTHDIGVVSRHVRSVACVNRRLFFHPDGVLSEDAMTQTFGCGIDLIAHGLPHRVFHNH